MHCSTKIAVALLNVAWVLFFLQPDPFSGWVSEVSVQKRSSHEEMVSEEFCTQPQFDINWTSTPHSVLTTSNQTNSTNTTTEVYYVETNKTAQDCGCNNRNMQPKDIKLLDIALRPPAPGCEPKIIMTFPNIELCVDVETLIAAVVQPFEDWNETAPEATGQQEDKQDKDSGHINNCRACPEYTRDRGTSLLASPAGVCSNGSDDCCFELYPRRLRKDLIRDYYWTNSRCVRRAVILVTQRSRNICVDPSLPWVINVMKMVDEKSF